MAAAAGSAKPSASIARLLARFSVSFRPEAIVSRALDYHNYIYLVYTYIPSTASTLYGNVRTVVLYIPHPMVLTILGQHGVQFYGSLACAYYLSARCAGPVNYCSAVVDYDLHRLRCAMSDGRE